MRIGIDLDDTVNFWYSEYVKMFGDNRTDAQITKDVYNKLRFNKEFWLGLPVKHYPNFKPTLICTKRISNKRWTKQWLKDNLGINPPVYQMYYQKGNKATMIKGKVDVFIDDSISNFKMMNDSGVPCLLMDSESNQNYDTPLRIYSLNYEEIEQIYNENF